MRLAGPLALVLLLAASPAALRAQDRRLGERLDPVTATAVQRLVDSARVAGLPTEPLVQKALEGSTLGAGGDRIRTAVASLYGQLSRARDALGSGASEPELTAAASAIRAGVPADTLRQLQTLRSGRSLVVPISVLTDLVAEGTPLDRASSSVFDLARAGRPDDDFVALRRKVETQELPEGPRPVADPPTEP